MGEVLKLVGIAAVAVSGAAVLKGYRPELAVHISIAAGVAILAFGIGAAREAWGQAEAFMENYSLDKGAVGTAVKIAGIAYIAQFGADTCRDSGESSLASKVELTGRLMMVGAAFPMIAETADAIARLIKP